MGDRIRLPDDVTMGYIIEHLLKKQLTVVEQFHSHLEPIKFLNEDTFHDQVSVELENCGRIIFMWMKPLYVCLPLPGVFNTLEVHVYETFHGYNQP